MIYIYATDHEAANAYIRAQGLPAGPEDVRVVPNRTLVYDDRPWLSDDDTIHILPGVEQAHEDRIKNAVAYHKVKPKIVRAKK